MNCLICKTPVEPNLEIKVKEGVVHGICKAKYDEIKLNLNESKKTVNLKDIQLL